MSIAISSEGLSKSYWIKVSPPVGGRKWVEKAALKDVSFTVAEGEVYGIIGRNGAGKSTLLKILSRISAPSRGRAVVYGNVVSLLEVGTGMHPEMTGLENIFLNGALLGMPKQEIRNRLEEIVEFAGVSEYIDTPIKRYSSGMKLRLAFAVAAHLSADVMIIDEVLAVGDAEFQKKCLGKMQEAETQGRTVLFVSHNMPMVMRLCNRVLLLEGGAVKADGSSREVIRHYLNSDVDSCAERVWPTLEDAPGDSMARMRAVRVKNLSGKVSESYDIRDPVVVEVEYLCLQPELRPTAILQFINEDGICLFATNEFNSPDWLTKPTEPGLFKASCQVPGNFFAEGLIWVLAAVGTYNPNIVHAIERDAVTFQVVDRSAGDGVRGVHAGDWPGVMRPMLNWVIEHDCETLAEITQ